MCSHGESRETVTSANTGWAVFAILNLSAYVQSACLILYISEHENSTITVQLFLEAYYIMGENKKKKNQH